MLTKSFKMSKKLYFERNHTHLAAALGYLPFTET
jgi:hypothetical protein